MTPADVGGLRPPSPSDPPRRAFLRQWTTACMEALKPAALRFHAERGRGVCVVMASIDGPELGGPWIHPALHYVEAGQLARLGLEPADREAVESAVRRYDPAREALVAYFLGRQGDMLRFVLRAELDTAPVAAARRQAH